MQLELARQKPQPFSRTPLRCSFLSLFTLSRAMSSGLAEEDDDVSSNDDDGDDLLDEDMEALRRACRLTGTDICVATAAAKATTSGRGVTGSDSDSEADDLEYVRSIQEKFSVQSSQLIPLESLPSFTSDDDEDDFETLRAIQRRFSAYDHSNMKERKSGSSLKFMEFNTSGTTFEKGTCSPTTTSKTDACKDFQHSQDACCSTHSLDNNNESERPDGDEWHPPDAHIPSTKTLNLSNFPKCGQFFVCAIKKNRSSQKMLRSKLIQIEARIEEIKELKKRVQTLKDFQVSCRKRTDRALSQIKKDPRIQLISSQGTRKNPKVNEKMIVGPAENAHVSKYRLALSNCSLSIYRRKWSEADKENLWKGLKRQFQEMVYRILDDKFSPSDGDSDGFKDSVALIKDIEITPEKIREFLPKVDWDLLASMYVAGRSGSDCEARWINWEDPLINHTPWTYEEDKHLLFVIEKKGINDWLDIAVSLGRNRTPFQCLSRYQRSLNPKVMRSEWTKEEDALLRVAVETFGEGNWQDVAFALVGRTGTQCSNRWIKTLHPQKERKGRWTQDEDRRLAVAVMLFGSKNWKKISELVPGRTHVQCRERWVNSLNPALKWDEWTAEEDAKLEAAIAEHGFSWSRIASCVPPRTDNQCLRRWKVLFPGEVEALQKARQMQRRALIGNFVDRECDRTLVGPEDFTPLQITYPQPTVNSADPPSKKLRKSRKRQQLEEVGDDGKGGNDTCIQKNVQPKRHRIRADHNTASTSSKVKPAKRRKIGSEGKKDKPNEMESGEGNGKPERTKEKCNGLVGDSQKEKDADSEDKSTDPNEPKERPKVGEDSGPNDPSIENDDHEKGVTSEVKGKEASSSVEIVLEEDDTDDGDCSLALFIQKSKERPLFLEKLKKRRLLFMNCKKRQPKGGVRNGN